MDNHFTHVDAAGNARMVDVGEKAVTHRTAVAVGRVTMSPECFAAVAGNDAGGYVRNRHTIPHSVYSPEKRKDKQAGNQNQYLTT